MKSLKKFPNQKSSKSISIFLYLGTAYAYDFSFLGSHHLVCLYLKTQHSFIRPEAQSVISTRLHVSQLVPTSPQGRAKIV